MTYHLHRVRRPSCWSQRGKWENCSGLRVSPDNVVRPPSNISVWACMSYRKFLQLLFHAQFCFWWFKTLLKVHLDVAEPVVKVLTLVCKRKEKSSIHSNTTWYALIGERLGPCSPQQWAKPWHVLKPSAENQSSPESDRVYFWSKHLSKYTGHPKTPARSVCPQAGTPSDTLTTWPRRLWNTDLWLEEMDITYTRH